MKNIDSHLQPKFFLKGFLAPKELEHHNESVFVYKKGIPFKTEGTKSERNPVRTGINKTAFIKNFYAFIKTDGTLDTETYERKLAHEIENPGNKIIKRLREVKLLNSETIDIDHFLNDVERRAFARYVGCMYARTKRSRKDFSKSLQKALDISHNVGYSYGDMEKDIPENQKEKIERHLYQLNPNFDKVAGRISISPEFSEDLRKEKETDKSFSEGIFRSVDIVAPFILKMKWQIGKTINPHSFFTGDDPVTWNNLRNPNALLVFPISSDTVFCGYNKQVSEKIYLINDHKYVEAIRHVFAEKCSEIYYSRQVKWLVDFFNKR